MLHVFCKTEEEKLLSAYSIWPVWNGNEVWLLGAIGSLFAAFPPVYATLLTSMYVFVFIFLVAIIFRAVSLEFREIVQDKFAKIICDYAFGIGSFIPAFLIGVVGGNVIQGIPINEKFIYIGNIFNLISPFSIFCGILSISFFLMYGALYLI